MVNEFLLAFGTLFPIVNPISTSFLFFTLTEKKTEKQRKRVALMAAATAALTLLLFLVMGNLILDFFNITLYAFRVAGGLYLAKVAFDMMNKKLRNPPEMFEDNPQAIAIIPLAIPLMAGPGAITSTLVIGSLYSNISVVSAILVTCAISWFVFLHAGPIYKALDNTGTSVIERILGILVLVIAVQFIFNGITGYLGTL